MGARYQVPNNMNKSAHISFDMLKEQFNVPLPVAADNLGLGTTAFKRVCRNNGVPKWPWRKLTSLDKKIEIKKKALKKHPGKYNTHVKELSKLKAEKFILQEGLSKDCLPNLIQQIIEKHTQERVWHNCNGSFKEVKPETKFVDNSKILSFDNSPNNESYELDNSCDVSYSNRSLSPPLWSPSEPLFVNTPTPSWFNEDRDKYIPKTLND